MLLTEVDFQKMLAFDLLPYCAMEVIKCSQSC